MNPDYLRPVADHLWQSALFAGIAGLLTLALQRNSARISHWLWLTASCKFLIPNFSSHCPARSALVAVGPICDPIWLVRRNGRGKPAVHGSVHLRASLTAAGARDPKPSSSDPVGHLDLRIRRYAFSWSIRWRRICATVRGGSPVPLAIPITATASRAVLEPGVFGVFQPTLLFVGKAHPPNRVHRIFLFSWNATFPGTISSSSVPAPGELIRRSLPSTRPARSRIPCRPR